MRDHCKLFVISDVHYASAAEKARTDFCNRVIRNPIRRFFTRAYRYCFWMRDPFAHNHLLDNFISAAEAADVVVANGDYSCDSGFIGVADDAAFQSAKECLDKLRARFGANFHATIGDHELGKKTLGVNLGGLRIESYHRATQELGLKRFWQVNVGSYALLGVTSTLCALPVFENEVVSHEVPTWEKFRAEHLGEIAEAFRDLQPDQRVLLFCHDPSALPYLAALAEVHEKLSQIERTIIGHLHSDLVLWKSQFLRGMPEIRFLGHTPHRISRALRQSRCWKSFNVMLCPSPAGIQLLKDGGYCSLELAQRKPVRFEKHRLRWS